MAEQGGPAESAAVRWFRRIVWWSLFVVFLLAAGWVLQQMQGA